jgi:hypothetical protein
MQTLQRSEHYIDNGHYAVMTRTALLKYTKLARIADHLCRNAEELVLSANPPTIDNCRIAGTMLRWAYDLVPLRIETRFDY